jgi:tRNA-dihydrouridine synthase
VLGNPWLFERVLGTRDSDPTPQDALAELEWIMEQAAAHLGPERAARYLRKFYPWYTRWLGTGPALDDALQRTENLAHARSLLRGALLAPAA